MHLATLWPQGSFKASHLESWALNILNCQGVAGPRLPGATKSEKCCGIQQGGLLQQWTYVQLGAKSKCLKRQPCGKYVFEKGNLLVKPRDLSISWHVCKIARHVFVVQVFFNDFPPTKKMVGADIKLEGVIFVGCAILNLGWSLQWLHDLSRGHPQKCG